jgi:two-component system sensor histidine kinase UhpB
VGNWVRGMPGARYDAEYRIVRPDGQIRWIADHGFILQTRGGTISRIAGIAEDITEKKRVDEALRQANSELEERVQSRTAELEWSRQELQALIGVQESFQEEERKRIARELHDELAQKLTVLKLRIASIMAVVSDKEPGLTHQIQDANSLLTEAIHAVGQIAANLRPVVLDELGLVAALRDLVEEFSQRTKVECELSVHPADLSVDSRLATPLYRMVQESLTNVARHAQATEVIVSLYRDASGTIKLDINDNGKGFSNVDHSMRRSFGLIGMRERAAMLGGEMKIHSQPGAGTSIEIVIPQRTAQPQARAGGTLN